jgi:hypothetical protein
MYVSSCFPHVVNLACKAVLANITKGLYDATTDAEEHNIQFLATDGFDPVLQRDPVAIIRAFTTAVRHHNL